MSLNLLPVRVYSTIFLHIFQVEERLKTLNVNSVTSDRLLNTFALGYESIDELITDVHCGGGDSIDFDYDHSRRLLVGAVLVSEVRAAVFAETGKTMSFCFH